MTCYSQRALRLWHSPAQPLWDVVERHFDEADFLTERWRAAFDEPDMTLRELAENVEARLLAHLEGLAIAGPRALAKLVWPALLDHRTDVSRTLCSALAILEQGELDDCARLLARLDEHTPADDRWVGIVAALGLSQRQGTTQWLRAQLEQAEGGRFAGIVEALAQRGAVLGPALTPLLASDDPTVLIAAARLASSGDASQLKLLTRLGTHNDHAVVAAVVETCLLREVGGSLDVARHWAFDAHTCEFRRSALLWLSLFGEAGDQGRVIALIDDPLLRPHALWAASFTGQIGAVEAALPWLGDTEVGPLAAELVTAIAGLPTDDDTLWLDREHETREELPELTKDLDATLELEPEALLPVPNPDTVAIWWHARRPERDQGHPLLAGQPRDEAALVRGLIEQPLRRRHALALLARRRSPREPAQAPLATRTWARVQLRQLTQKH